MTDLTTMATSVAAVITPFLPLLKGAVDKAAGKSLEEIGKQTGGAAFDFAKKIWGKLSPKIEDKKVAEQLEKGPEGEQALTNYNNSLLPKYHQIKSLVEKLGQKDPELVDELKLLVQEAEKENGGRPFNEVYTLKVGSQVGDKIINIGHIGIATFNL